MSHLGCAHMWYLKSPALLQGMHLGASVFHFSNSVERRNHQDLDGWEGNPAVVLQFWMLLSRELTAFMHAQS